ncbi:MAG: DnaJ C-terminal domain-containing protein, partial [bacterium]|nr:DnaJ C-terminal domain-containing protein [bacterium]
IAMEVTVDFREAAFGTKKDIKLYKTITCKTCSGSGAQPNTPINTCKQCGGRGQVGTVKQTIFGAVQALTTCPQCKGSGKHIEKPCKECRGVGVSKAEERFDITIPAGINNGETLRIKGQGEAGLHGGPSGDLYITVRVKGDKRFVREGYDLHIDLPIRFTQSVLGDTISVETLDGSTDVKIPAGTQSGTVFRVQNQGVPFLHKKGRGDLLVTVNILTPSHISRKQRELLEKLKEENL